MPALYPVTKDIPEQYYISNDDELQIEKEERAGKLPEETSVKSMTFTSELGVPSDTQVAYLKQGLNHEPRSVKVQSYILPKKRVSSESRYVFCTKIRLAVSHEK